MDSGKLSMSHEWSRVVSPEVKKEYMTLQGRLQDYFLSHCSKVKRTFKVHLSLTLMRVKLVNTYSELRSELIHAMRAASTHHPQTTSHRNQIIIF